ncbi:MAG: hypothetical protein UU73_C0001G0083 [Candidatus Daviesbacteria bacterium GW2011_GWA1_41_61]|uniref:POTRA domain-containing protein n=1 Tax=Candidatus Daviesbacteria bacterium GW2011_GWA2_40_9 TaxID=1618424 RepID=A0A0G0U6Z0_9BACT|nr:MAG: hypothetical protein UU26_C0002G0020 [Candidatus Daviesbacteria bacterium GW2011_GWC1_40_9]KKR82976.1 MAG: hypothetical protein UU29_C0008G0085 [Candidatus Daviesbacteria bacterium GW2011_GWA2_40_9]KKR92902.1 MAG: hypothetical protein UU44_C0004G0084 [Candidatus Daviesbacteria bacterium GW2011_GWB1_41_15]KKS15446.1 MAG: hypothetical protein UU73_C0001G0083 [Candidatus Daviesbacteria bacterium GW2011_GWA1_41_61]
MIRGKKTVILLFFLVVLITLAIFKTDLLKTDSIEWEAKNAACLDTARVKSEINLQHNYFFYINEKAIFQKTVSLYPCVKSLRWERKFIKGIKIIAEGRVPLIKIAPIPTAALDEDLTASPSSSTALLDWSLPEDVKKLYIADSEGYVFAQGQEFQLPILYYLGDELKLGQKIEGDLLTKLEQVILNLGKLEIQAQDSSLFKFKKSGDFLLVYSRPKLVFSLSGDIFRQLGSLQLILQKAKIDEKEMETVDLRFDKPVVVYSSSKSND